MPERTLKQKRWGRLFLALHLLLISQIVWWAIVFSRYVNSHKELKMRNAVLESQINHVPTPSLTELEQEAFHQKTMFFSESAFFALIASLALWLLFRALKTEERSRKIQRNFIEVLTHESKTPLTALKLRLESVKEKLGANPLSDDLRRALEEVRRLIGIFDKSLELNRLDRYAPTFEQVNLGELITGVLKRMEPLFKEKEVQVEIEVPKDLWVRGDSFGLQNSIQSLVENSVLYNDSIEKKLFVTLKKDYGSATLSVRDNGPGISQPDSNLIFERFYRGKAGKRVPGTGLGLYLCRQIILAHKGIIRLIPEASGAHFEIKLPLQESLG
ncbi:MAG: sensor histidine kinase [Proteobacteria bacterium]|nr:sensor histidine kinase [Pseudomonadota bacterium]